MQSMPQWRRPRCSTYGTDEGRRGRRSFCDHLHCERAQGLRIERERQAPSGATLAHFNGSVTTGTERNWGPGSGMPHGGILTLPFPAPSGAGRRRCNVSARCTFSEVLAAGDRLCAKRIPGLRAHRARMGTAERAAACEDAARSSILIRSDLVCRTGSRPRPDRSFGILIWRRHSACCRRTGAMRSITGEIARAIVAKSRALGGTMTLEDLAGYHGEWVEPAQVDYHGYDVLELPPPSQAWAANEMLNILQACVPKVVPGRSLASLGPANPEYWHMLVEAKKLAYADLYRIQRRSETSLRFRSPAAVRMHTQIALRARSIPVARIARGRPARRAAPATRSFFPPPTAGATWSRGSTATTTDSARASRSRIRLHTAQPRRPVHARPEQSERRSRRTNGRTIPCRPASSCSDGRPVMTLALMGGDMQAQGHEQIARRHHRSRRERAAGRRHGALPPQPDLRHAALESPLYALVGNQLRAMGHNVRPRPRADGRLSGDHAFAERRVPRRFRFWKRRRSRRLVTYCAGASLLSADTLEVRDRAAAVSCGDVVTNLCVHLRRP